jgi:spermidine synthase
MLPVHPGSYILCEYIADWHQVKSDECYVVVTRDDGLVYKRVINRLGEDGTFSMKSDNPTYATYTLAAENIFEVWKARGFVSFRLPESGEGADGVRHVSEVLREIHSDVKDIQQRISSVNNQFE